MLAVCCRAASGGWRACPPLVTRRAGGSGLTLAAILRAGLRAHARPVSPPSQGWHIAGSSPTWNARALFADGKRCRRALGNLCAGARFRDDEKSEAIFRRYLGKSARKRHVLASSLISAGRFPACRDTTPPEGPAGCGVGTSSPARRPRTATGGSSTNPGSAAL